MVSDPFRLQAIASDPIATDPIATDPITTNPVAEDVTAGARTVVDPDGPDADQGRDFVQSLDRGLAVIRAFDADHPQLTLSDVARRTGLTRAAARRFLLTLQTIGYVGSDGRYFSLRPRVLDLGYAYLASLSLTDVVQDHLARAAEELHESCSASVLDGDHIVYIARASTKRIMAINLTVGTRLPAAATSMGRVLLAALPAGELTRCLAGLELSAHTDRTIVDREKLRQEIGRVREQGWCLVDQELETGVRSCALPVHDADGRVIAAINASAHASRVTLAAFKKTFLPRLLTAGMAIEADLRARR